MTIRLAINGFGRIGRNVLRALYTGHYREQLQVVAINDLGDAAVNAHLFQYDSVHGRFPGEVEHDAESLRVMGDRIAVSAIRNPAELPWKSLGVDIVLECTGLFTSRDKAAAHLQAGAGKVLISAPGKDVDATVVYGVNHEVLRASHRIVSNASCTTNCLAPVAQVLHRELGIEHGLMTTIHAYTNDQNLSDVYHPDLYRARSATQSMIPTKTGAAEAVGLVLPELAGKLTGLAVRVPVINVSLVDLTVQVARDTSVDEVNRLLREASEGSRCSATTPSRWCRWISITTRARRSSTPTTPRSAAGWSRRWPGTTTSGASPTACWTAPWRWPPPATDAPQRNLRRPRACNASRRRSASARISRCSALSARFQARISWRVRPQPRHTSASNSQILMQGLFKRSPFFGADRNRSSPVTSRQAAGRRPGGNDYRADRAARGHSASASRRLS